jgi:hypothetical protein
MVIVTEEEDLEVAGCGLGRKNGAQRTAKDEKESAEKRHGSENTRFICQTRRNHAVVEARREVISPLDQ